MLNEKIFLSVCLTYFQLSFTNNSEHHDVIETEFFYVYLIFKTILYFLTLLTTTKLSTFPHQLTLYYTFLHIGCAIEPLVKEIFLELPVVRGHGT